MADRLRRFCPSQLTWTPVRRSRTFFAAADLNPAASLITGVVCGIRVEDVEDPLMQKIRYLDKLVDELAKGKAMEKVLRD